MSRRNELKLFSEKHNIPMVTIKDLIEYRIRHETLGRRNGNYFAFLLQAMHGDFMMTVFTNKLDSAEHFALVKAPKLTNQLPLVRIHSECITVMFGSCKCDCGVQFATVFS